MLPPIVLVHPNGEERTVPVEYVAINGSYVTIRWGAAGLYDLFIVTNTLCQRSAEKQSKGKAKWYKKDKPVWKAKDIEKVRRDIKERMGRAGKEVSERIEKHTASMPGNPGIRKEES